jgi:hypothetical protein
MMEQERMSLQSSKRSSESHPSESTGYRWKFRIRVPEQKATATQSSWWNNFHGGNTPGGSTVHQLGDISQRSKTPRIRNTRSQADDLCTNCSTWGHQERNCTASARCGICSDGHRTDRHPNIRNGKNKFRCPNCSGNHQVHHSSCLARAAAVQKQERRMGNVVPREGGPSRVNSGRAGKDKKMEKKRGAPRSPGPGRQ